jgi:hypothetical protein
LEKVKVLSARRKDESGNIFRREADRLPERHAEMEKISGVHHLSPLLGFSLFHSFKNPGNSRLPNAAGNFQRRTISHDGAD